MSKHEEDKEHEGKSGMRTVAKFGFRADPGKETAFGLTKEEFEFVSDFTEKALASCNDTTTAIEQVEKAIDAEPKLNGKDRGRMLALCGMFMGRYQEKTMTIKKAMINPLALLAELMGADDPQLENFGDAPLDTENDNGNNSNNNKH